MGGLQVQGLPGQHGETPCHACTENLESWAWWPAFRPRHLFVRARQEDCLSPGDCGHPEQHGETHSSQKIIK